MSDILKALQFPNADDCRKMALEAKELKLSKTLGAIRIQIEDAVCDGKLSVTIFGKIDHSVIDALTGIGFAVSVGNDCGEAYCCIDWSKPHKKLGTG